MGMKMGRSAKLNQAQRCEALALIPEGVPFAELVTMSTSILTRIQRAAMKSEPDRLSQLPSAQTTLQSLSYHPQPIRTPKELAGFFE